MTFRKAFNDIFSMGLKEYGFKYCKKYGIHIRLVNNELIQYITYISNPAITRGYKAYTVFSGIASIYCSSVSKEMLIMLGSGIYYYEYSFADTSYTAINGYEYNEVSMTDVIEKSLKHTKEIIIPVFDRVKDLGSYIEYRKRLSPSFISGAKDFSEDSLALIKADNHDDFADLLQQETERLRQWQAEGKLGYGEAFDEAYNLLYDGIIVSIVKSRDEVYNTPKLYVAALREAERRREANLLTLYECGAVPEN